MAYVTQEHIDRALQLSKECAEVSCEINDDEQLRRLLAFAGAMLHRLAEAAEPWDFPEIPSKYDHMKAN